MAGDAARWAASPPGGYYLIQQAQGPGGTTAAARRPMRAGTIAMAAGAGKVALQVTTAAIVGQCPVERDGGSRRLRRHRHLLRRAGTDGRPSNTTAALRKRGGCVDSDNNNVDFSVGSPAPRNSATPIAELHSGDRRRFTTSRASGSTSPFADQDVITDRHRHRDQVERLLPASAGRQRRRRPGNVGGASSCSRRRTPAVAVGNEVSARGTVSEFFSLTQIESSLPGDVTVTAPSVALPAAVTLTPAMLDPAGSPDQLERFEGMRMHAASLTSVAPTDEFRRDRHRADRRAQADARAGYPGAAIRCRPIRRPACPTAASRDSTRTRSASSSTARGWSVPRCCPSRRTSSSPTSRARSTSRSAPTRCCLRRRRATAANMTGVPVPVPAADEFTVGGFNIENFAGSETQPRKAALAIRQLMRSPDVIGHIEILDLATLQTLARPGQRRCDGRGRARPRRTRPC